YSISEADVPTGGIAVQLAVDRLVPEHDHHVVPGLIEGDRLAEGVGVATVVELAAPAVGAAGSRIVAGEGEVGGAVVTSQQVGDVAGAHTEVELRDLEHRLLVVADPDG